MGNRTYQNILPSIHKFFELLYIGTSNSAKGDVKIHDEFDSFDMA